MNDMAGKNRAAGQSVPVALSSKDNEDSESIKQQFGWVDIGNSCVPFLIRTINGEHVRFVSVRISENQILKTYFKLLDPKIFTYCTSVESYLITKAEAKMINDINQIHSEGVYGKEQFQPNKDYIVRLEDVLKLYTFLEVCYKKLFNKNSTEINKFCGYMFLQHCKVYVPYCIINEKKYMPLFYFNDKTKYLFRHSIKLENQSLSYLKFCILLLRLNIDCISSDSMDVVTFEVIKSELPSETFEDKWPENPANLLIDQNTFHRNISGAWIKPRPAAPIKEPAPESILRNTLLVPSPSQSIPLPYDKYQKSGQSSNQIGPTTLIQSNNLMSSVDHIPLPPLVSTLTKRATSDVKNVVYSENGPISQPSITCIPIQSTSKSNPKEPTNVSMVSNHEQRQSRELVTSQSQKTDNSPSLLVSRPNSHERNTADLHKVSRNAAATIPPPGIYLSSPPSNPTPQITSEEHSRLVSIQTPERTLSADQDVNVPYKVQTTYVLGKVMHCINSKPFWYTDYQMVILSDLVNIFLPSYTVSRCAHVLRTHFKMTLYSPNFNQLSVLRENGCNVSVNLDDTLLAMLPDIAMKVPQLQIMTSMNDKQIEIYLENGRRTKRQHMG